MQITSNNYYNNISFGYRISSATKADFQKYVAAGKTNGEIAKIYGKSSSWVSWMLKKFGLVCNKREAAQSLADTVPKLIKSCYSIKEISNKLGLSERTISTWIKLHIEEKVSDIKHGVMNYLKNEQNDGIAAKELNLDIETIQDIRLRKGLVNEMTRKELYEDRKAKIFQAFRDGVAINDITQKYGITKRAVYNYRADYLENELKVLSEEDRRRYIKLRLDNGASMDDIVKELVGLGKGMCKELAHEKAILERRASNSYKENTIRMVISKFKQGMTLKEIEKDTGIEFNELTKYVMSGDKKTKKVITNIFRQRFIKSKLQEGMNIKEVARIFGVDKATAYRYLGKENIRELRNLKHEKLLTSRKKKNI